MMRRLALAVGDTAGHVMPALAIAEAYRELFADLDVRFFAAGEGAGHWLIERAGFSVDFVPGSQIARTTRLNQALALGRTALGAVRARTLLQKHGSRLVIGTGGYGSAAALVAARSLGLRTALVEPNVVPGLANQLLGRVADRAYLAFEETAKRFPRGRPLVTGVPMRRSATGPAGLRSTPVFPRLRLLVMSGSRGEQFFGQELPQLCERLTSRGLTVEVTHQGGTDAAAIQASYDRRGIQARVEPFIADVASALATTDIAITRAGAGTIAELSAAAVPAFLVPLADAAHDHQAFNAAALVARGAAWTARETEWDAEAIADRMSAIIRTPGAWDKMSRAMSMVAGRDGAKRIVQDCEVLMEGRW